MSILVSYYYYEAVVRSHGRLRSIGPLHAFLVSYCGVVISLIGASAHGLPSVGAIEVMSNGDRVIRRPMRIGIARRMGRSRSLRLS